MTLKIEILKILEKKRCISGEVLASQLGVSRSDIHKHIDSLRKNGYIIHARPNAGYILVEKPHESTYDNLKYLLKNELPDLKIEHFPSIDSTQLYLKKIAERGASEWTVVTADVQSGGYGRLRRRWDSGRGGLWFSVLLRPLLPPANIGGLSLIASLAVMKTINELTGLKCLVKWPNDVLIQRENLLKVAGIITEMSTDIESVNWVVLGMGINTNNAIPPELKNVAVSLKSIVNKHISNVSMLKVFLVNFKVFYEKFLKSGFAVFKDEYNKKSSLTGKKVEVKMLDKKYKGIALGVDDEGNLVIESGGKKMNVIAGDVTILKKR